MVLVEKLLTFCRIMYLNKKWVLIRELLRFHENYLCYLLRKLNLQLQRCTVSRMGFLFFLTSTMKQLNWKKISLAKYVDNSVGNLRIFLFTLIVSKLPAWRRFEFAHGYLCYSNNIIVAYHIEDVSEYIYKLAILWELVRLILHWGHRLICRWYL